MPTGYTAAIIDGEGIEFKDFALLCAREFGATIHMRDEPTDNPPAHDSVSDYHPHKIESTKNRIIHYQNTHRDKLKDEFVMATESARKKLEEVSAKDKQNLSRLTAILREAEKWEPPTGEHIGLQEFMISQINQTIGFDCHSADYHAQRLKKLDAMTLDEWIEDKLIHLYQELKYHREELKKEQKRVAGRNKWIDELYKSLDREPTQV